MASFLRPRRGKKATATSQLTASNPLKRGEIFFEVPDTGVGTGTGKIKMGDGTTAYASLPYFMEQPTVDYTNAVVAWTNTTAASSAPYTDNATYVGNIIPSASLKTIFTNLKKLLLNYNSQLTTLNNDLASFQNGVDTIVEGCTTYGSTPSDDTPSAIVSSIGTIYTNRYNAGVSATKKGTATAAQVLTGYTFTNSSSIGASGSMANNGAVTKAFTPSLTTQSYTIPAGYHNGSGKVTVAAAPTSLINGDAVAADVLSGKKFFSDSYTVKTGTMANNGAKTASLNCGGSYTIPAGYHNGSGKITANSLASQTSATATAAQILSGYTAWVNGAKLTGTASPVSTSVTNLTYTSVNGKDSFTATTNKTYLVAYGIVTGNKDATYSVSSGGTVQKSYRAVSASYSSCYTVLYIYIIKATATTVSLTGYGNCLIYAKLD